MTSWEILQLRQELADAAEGRRFLLQGGDCAENLERLRQLTHILPIDSKYCCR